MTLPFCNWSDQYKQAAKSTRCVCQVQEAGFPRGHSVTSPVSEIHAVLSLIDLDSFITIVYHSVEVIGTVHGFTLMLN